MMILGTVGMDGMDGMDGMVGMVGVDGNGEGIVTSPGLEGSAVMDKFMAEDSVGKLGNA